MGLSAAPRAIGVGQKSCFVLEDRLIRALTVCSGALKRRRDPHMHGLLRFARGAVAPNAVRGHPRRPFPAGVTHTGAAHLQRALREPRPLPTRRTFGIQPLKGTLRGGETFLS